MFDYRSIGIRITSLGGGVVADYTTGDVKVCDKATDWLYIADTKNNRIQVYKPAAGPAS